MKMDTATIASRVAGDAQLADDLRLKPAAICAGCPQPERVWICGSTGPQAGCGPARPASACRDGQARSEYSIVSVLMMIASPSPMKGGTIIRTPLSRIAGL